jgi:RNA polymerase sigma-70 factor (ECF subfamily)
MISFVVPITNNVYFRPQRPSIFTESDLVKGLLNGNTWALETVYSSYSASLLGIISKIIRQQDLAEDVLQETFVKIWKSIPQYDAGKGRLFTWMSRLARNKAIDHLRSRGEANSMRNEDLEIISAEVNEQHQTNYNPEHIGLKQLMRTLSPAQIAILELIYFQGYTQSEVAEALQIPVGTVKTRLRAAIKTLRGLF